MLELGGGFLLGNGLSALYMGHGLFSKTGSAIEVLASVVFFAIAFFKMGKQS